MTVCFVDDDYSVRKWVKRLKLPSDFRVTESPKEALDWVRNGIVKVLVADLNMPEMDGITLLKASREIDSSCDLLLLTGHLPTDSEKVDLESVGADIFYKSEFDSFYGRLLSIVTGDEKNSRRSWDLGESESEGEDLTKEANEQASELLKSAYVRELVLDIVNPLINSLKKIEVQDEVIFNTSYTVRELIEHIQKLTPVGCEYIRLWERTRNTLSKLGKK